MSNFQRRFSILMPEVFKVVSLRVESEYMRILELFSGHTSVS